MYMSLTSASKSLKGSFSNHAVMSVSRAVAGNVDAAQRFDATRM
jgi:hypothetical protein